MDQQPLAVGAVERVGQRVGAETAAVAVPVPHCGVEGPLAGGGAAQFVQMALEQRRTRLAVGVGGGVVGGDDALVTVAHHQHR